MSTDDTTQNESYDPATDPDADPEMLNPRTGDQASSTGDATGDPDAEPGNLNPRAEGADQGDVTP